MFSFIGSIVSGVFNYVKNFVFYSFYSISLTFTKIYLSINDKFVDNTEKFKYIATYYQSLFDVSEYEISHGNVVDRLKFVGGDFELFVNCSDTQKHEILDEKNKILNCCVVDTDGNIVFDCTEDLRCFRFYFNNKAGRSLQWGTFLEHLVSTKPEPYALNNCKLLICKNDSELSEIVLELEGVNLDSHIRL